MRNFVLARLGRRAFGSFEDVVTEKVQEGINKIVDHLAEKAVEGVDAVIEKVFKKS